jgi:phospholipid N-methyltransferase
MVDWLDLGAARSVLEYGPGTGPFTPHILKRMGVDCRFLAIERNATLAEEFRRKLPDVELIQDSVENVRAICDRAGIDSVDCYCLRFAVGCIY